MKLATYQDGSRDGHLVLVSRDASQAVFANTQATRLQQLLDDWNFIAPQLNELSLTLNHGKARHAFAFDPAMCLAPLPRGGRWIWQPLDAPDAQPGSHPALHTGAADDMRGPRAELVLAEGRLPARLDAGVAVLTGDLALGSAPAQALEAVRLLGLYSRCSLAPREGEAAAVAGDADHLAPQWAPLLVTPDEVEPAWASGRLALQLQLQWQRDDGRPAGTAQLAAGPAQRWHYGQLLAWATRPRRLRAATMLGCDWLGAAVPDAADVSVVARPPAQISAATIDVTGADGLSVFGSIEPHWSVATPTS